LFRGELFAYQYFIANREKVQSAWHRWSLYGARPGNVLANFVPTAAFIGGDFWAVSFILQTGNSHYEILRMQFDPTPDTSGLGVRSDSNHLVPFLDYWQIATGVASGGSTKVTVDGTLNNLTNPGAEPVCIAYGTGWPSPGTEITAARTRANPTPDTLEITFPDQSWNGRRLLIGVRYRSIYEFGNPVLKQENRPILGGRYLIRRVRPQF